MAEWDWPDTGGYCTASTLTVTATDLRAVLGEDMVTHAWQRHQATERNAQMQMQQAHDEAAASVERHFRVTLDGEQWAAYDERGMLLGYAPATPDEHGRYHPARDDIAEELYAAMPSEGDYQPVLDHAGVWRVILPW